MKVGSNFVRFIYILARGWGNGHQLLLLYVSALLSYSHVAGEGCEMYKKLKFIGN